MTRVSAVVVAYGAEPHLSDCLDALLASAGVDLDVVLVDNGDTSGAVDKARGRPGVQVLDPGRNTGFAEGCNLGAQAATGEVLALVNPDVIVAADAMRQLARAALRPGVGIATASVRLGSDPELMNSAGNPVHYVGLAWAGGHGEPAAAHAREEAVASASGACCALARALWQELGGFEPEYFAYHEDVDLSLRCRLRGRSVVYVPDALAIHHYEFSRNALKNELLERNRWLTVLRVYSARTLTLLLPALLAVEVMMLAVAAGQGWLPAKLKGYRWLWAHRRRIREGRAAVQQQRTCTDRELAAVLSGRLYPTNVERIPGMGLVSAGLAGYWAVVRRLL